MNTAEFLLMAARWWGTIGAVVAAAFLTFGMDRIDDDADDAYVFRPLLIPGILLIWPLVLWRWGAIAFGWDNWASRYRPRRERHCLFAYALPLAIVAVITAGLSVRQSWPDHIAPEQIAAPEAGQ